MRNVAFNCMAASLVLLAVPSAARAQTSASFKLTESTFNGGGSPSNGGIAISASYHITIDAVGQPATPQAASSPAFSLGTGFVAGFTPPGEVQQLRFTDKITLAWNPEASTGTYGLYRDALSTLPGGFGSCLDPGSSTEAATDAATPPTGGGWFYLVTAKNRLGEEGTKGARTGGVERANPAPCP